MFAYGRLKLQGFSAVLRLPGLQLGVFLCGLSSSGKCSLPGVILKRKSYIVISFYWRVVQYSQIDSIGVSGDKKGLHWYQWYDWYQ